MWQDIINALFPKRCINCEVIIPRSQKYVCEVCKLKIPFTGIILGNDNPIYEKIDSLESASSLLFFKENNITQKFIHYLKYKNLPEIGEWLAEIWVEQNKNNPVLDEIESVVPVPIHSKRLKKRNYNQIYLCSRKIADLLGCDFDDEVLVRIQHMESQTNLGKHDRLSRMQGAFQSVNQESKHYLLVDDVFTTGATLTSCTQELLKVQGTKVSIFTLAMA